MCNSACIFLKVTLCMLSSCLCSGLPQIAAFVHNFTNKQRSKASDSVRLMLSGCSADNHVLGLSLFFNVEFVSCRSQKQHYSDKC